MVLGVLEALEAPVSREVVGLRDCDPSGGDVPNLDLGAGLGVAVEENAEAVLKQLRSKGAGIRTLQPEKHTEMAWIGWSLRSAQKKNCGVLHPPLAASSKPSMPNELCSSSAVDAGGFLTFLASASERSVPALRSRGVQMYDANPVAMTSSWYMVPMRSTYPRNLAGQGTQLGMQAQAHTRRHMRSLTCPTNERRERHQPLSILVAGNDELVPQGIKLVALVVHHPAEVRVDIARAKVAPVVVGIIIAAAQAKSKIRAAKNLLELFFTRSAAEGTFKVCETMQLLRAIYVDQ